ncbi:MAG TPA: hypothetical protein VFA88_01820 [Gaiellaceae bacterium]|nr:hypothetical protein [Gaiellaceae bacterium]
MRIVIGSYVVRFPLGGYLSWVGQWLHGFARLGHEVTLVERAGWRDACFDPRTGAMGDDCAYGVATVTAFLERLGLSRFGFEDADGRTYGLTATGAFAGADLFVDMGAHGSFAEEAEQAAVRILVDGEPGYTQMKGVAADYDAYYTVGLNVGTSRSTVPTAGVEWRPIFDPVALELYAPLPPAGDAYTTVMSWQAHGRLEHDGRVYGQKDLELPKFLDLPGRVRPPLELAIAGKHVPRAELEGAGWRLRDAHAASATFDAWRDYIAGSRGELAVCKQVFVATWSGWFSDRSACYLASGRPVIMQDTGFSEHLPCGEGLHAFSTLDEAAAAIEAVEADYRRNALAARRIAEEYLATDVVLPRLVSELGF